MGIIKRQSIKNSIVNYVGVLIGAISVIFIYPQIDENDLGMIQFTMNTAILFAPLAGFALSLTAIQFYTDFHADEKENTGYLFLLSASTFVFSVIFVCVIYAFRHAVSPFFGNDAIKFLNALPYILVFTVIISLANLFNAYTALFNRVVVPSILQNLLIKIALPILVLLFAFGYISFADVYKGMTFTLLCMLLGLIWYIGYLGQLKLKPNFDLLKIPLLKRMVSYSSFNIIVSFGGLLAQRVDLLLIVPMTQQFGNAAVFGFGFFISEAIDVPRKALSSIASPMISNSLKTHNIAHVNEIYRKSALLQLIAGVFLLAGVWACADSLFDLMPKNGEVYRVGKNIILILGVARLVDMATGINAEIITYSQYYRFNFISLLTMAIMNVSLNLLLIPRLGIEGSAYATLSSIIVVNFWRMLFIYQKMTIHPLTIKMLWVVLIGIAGWYIAKSTPSVSLPILNILLKGIVVTTVYGTGIIYFKISEDVTAIFEKGKNLLKIGQ